MKVLMVSGENRNDFHEHGGEEWIPMRVENNVFSWGYMTFTLPLDDCTLPHGSITMRRRLISSTTTYIKWLGSKWDMWMIFK